MPVVVELFSVFCWKFAVVSSLFSSREKWPGVVGVWPSTGGGELTDRRAALRVPFQWSA